MKVKEAILTLNANVIIACERAGFSSATVKMIEDALGTIEDALKEQEPKTILGIADSIEGMEVGKCPRCERTIASKQSDPTWFCKFCGQAVIFK